jgi:N-acetylglucosaminyldiphosphoundecaprenol N-acetyl-beta-D-mannosaminyltransferase
MSRVKLLGVEVDALTMDDLHALIAQAVAGNERWIVANHNTHSVYLWHHDSRMRVFYQRAHRVHVDGMPLILLAKFLGLPLRREHRVTYADWVRPLMTEAGRRGFRIFYVGSRPGVAQRGAAVLQAEFPDLRIETHHGYFDTASGSRENAEVLAAIRRFRPDILMAGMGMPRQEHWILDNLHDIDAHAILTAGACMDYVAGIVPTPPRWMGRIGLEWLYRLGMEPSRLWRRYLLEPWFVLGLFAQDLWRKRGGASGTGGS